MIKEGYDNDGLDNPNDDGKMNYSLTKKLNTNEIRPPPQWSSMAQFIQYLECNQMDMLEIMFSNSWEITPKAIKTWLLDRRASLKILQKCENPNQEIDVAVKFIYIKLKNQLFFKLFQEYVFYNGNCELKIKPLFGDNDNNNNNDFTFTNEQIGKIHERWKNAIIPCNGLMDPACKNNGFRNAAKTKFISTTEYENDYQQFPPSGIELLNAEFDRVDWPVLFDVVNGKQMMPILLAFKCNILKFKTIKDLIKGLNVSLIQKIFKNASKQPSPLILKRAFWENFDLFDETLGAKEINEYKQTFEKYVDFGALQNNDKYDNDVLKELFIISKSDNTNENILDTDSIDSNNSNNNNNNKQKSTTKLSSEEQILMSSDEPIVKAEDDNYIIKPSELDPQILKIIIMII